MLRFTAFLETLNREEEEEGKRGMAAVAGICQPSFQLFLPHGNCDSFLGSCSSKKKRLLKAVL